MKATATAKAKHPGPAAKCRIVEESGLGLLFEDRRDGRRSAYMQALQELADAGEGKILEVEKPSARAQMTQKAKKLGMSLLFAEKDGRLYVKLAGISTPEALALKFLADGGPATLDEIVEYFTHLQMQNVSPAAIMRTLSDNHKAALQTIGGVKKWVAL